MQITALCLVLLLLIVPQEGFTQSPSKYRGPIPVEDPFPLAVFSPTIDPETPKVLPTGILQFQQSLLWSNTINRKGRTFLIDAETRVLRFGVQAGIGEGKELSFEVPLIWRGAGVMDGPIYDWHKAFGLSQGPRDDRDIEDDSYSIVGQTEQGQRFDIGRRGTAFGDLRVGSKFQLCSAAEDPLDLALTLQLQLPTAARSYGLNGPVLSAGVLGAYYGRRIGLYFGGGYSYLSDSGFEEIRYERHRFSGFTALEIPFEPLSLLLQLTAGSNLLENVSRFPNYQVYLDTGLKVPLNEAVDLQFLIRENPAPDHGTADFSVYLGLASRLGL